MPAAESPVGSPTGKGSADRRRPLRADIHTLFDLGLLAVNPATLTIVRSDGLPGTHYEQFQWTPLTSPDNPRCRPSQVLLVNSGRGSRTSRRPIRRPASSGARRDQMRLQTTPGIYNL